MSSLNMYGLRGLQAASNQLRAAAIFNDYGDGRPHVTVGILDSRRNWQQVRLIADSVTGETRLYWKQAGVLKFGTMEDLFMAYTSFADKDRPLFEVISVKRDPELAAGPNGSTINGRSAIPCFSRISAVVYHGIREVWKLTLRNGKTIELTDDHSLIFSTAVPGRFVPGTLKQIEGFGRKAGVISVDKYPVESNLAQPAPFDEDMLTFMGLWLADGSYQKASINVATGRDQRIIQWLAQFWGRLPERLKPVPHMREYRRTTGTLVMCQDGRHLRYGVKGDMSLNGMVFREFIHGVFGDVDSYSKRVPQFMFTATETQISAFLRGYFSGDGSIHLANSNPANVNFKYGAYWAVDCASVSRALLEDVSVLLDRLGIRHNISTPTKPSGCGFKTNRSQYKLIIHASPDVDRFMKVVGFINKGEHYKPREHYVRNKYLRPFSFRQPRTIEYTGVKPVYDISVDETEMFVANGILCHNSGNDLTLLNLDTGRMLGFTPEMGSPMKVAGISQQSQDFYQIQTMMQVADFPPFPVTVAIGKLGENLLGRRDVFGKFQITFDQNRAVIFSKFCSTCH